VLSLIFFRATAIVYTFVANEILIAALNQVQSAFAQPETLAQQEQSAFTAGAMESHQSK